mmetsp:Transcript_7037/g.16684  ORF Transcript_7037/g.16684 Transcript_7037/m.16684 type:complete len:218 (-) Transcript_7037:4040-4693(-)
MVADHLAHLLLRKCPAASPLARLCALTDCIALHLGNVHFLLILLLFRPGILGHLGARFRSLRSTFLMRFRHFRIAFGHRRRHHLFHMPLRGLASSCQHGKLLLDACIHGVLCRRPIVLTCRRDQGHLRLCNDLCGLCSGLALLRGPSRRDLRSPLGGIEAPLCRALGRRPLLLRCKELFCVGDREAHASAEALRDSNQRHLNGEDVGWWPDSGGQRS